MEIKEGDILELKKVHPCGCREWNVIRVGMDFKIQCRGCGHILMMPRNKILNNVKKVIKDN